MNHILPCSEAPLMLSQSPSSQGPKVCLIENNDVCLQSMPLHASHKERIPLCLQGSTINQGLPFPHNQERKRKERKVLSPFPDSDE